MWTMAGWKAIILGTDARSIQLQLVVLLAVALLHIYQILYMRRKTVVVLSHGRVFVGALWGSLASVGFFQAILRLHPTGRWWIAVVLAFLFWKSVLYVLTSPLTRGTSVVDTISGEGGLFNCNWPLIPRCVHQSLFYFLLFVWSISRMPPT